MKTKVKHTPGPWKVTENVDDGMRRWHEIVGDGIVVSRCEYKYDNQENADEQIANARLIAAAPELLEALKGLIEAVNETILMPQAFERAEAVIAKAEGRN